MIKSVEKVDLHLRGIDPFLFCAHHLDKYPRGGAELDLDPVFLKGRNLGSDFSTENDFRMYHGESVPGFPVHPHRGFETITIARQGFVDHADSLGAAGRFGKGDVQWMTAGAGVQHSEMFPLLSQEQENTLEIFQIWLNLPAKNKMVQPDFKMLWHENIPVVETPQGVLVKVVCGSYQDTHYNEAPKNSWAADSENKVNIFMITIPAGEKVTLPKSSTPTTRMLYFFDGREIKMADQIISQRNALELESAEDAVIEAVGSEAQLLFLEAKPIQEPVVQYGPFVMNTKQEILKAISDYQQTDFGGWSWERSDMVHKKVQGRFAKYPDGRTEYPPA